MLAESEQGCSRRRVEAQLPLRRSAPSVAPGPSPRRVPPSRRPALPRLLSVSLSFWRSAVSDRQQGRKRFPCKREARAVLAGPSSVNRCWLPEGQGMTFLLSRRCARNRKCNGARPNARLGAESSELAGQRSQDWPSKCCALCEPKVEGEPVRIEASRPGRPSIAAARDDRLFLRP